MMESSIFLMPDAFTVFLNKDDDDADDFPLIVVLI